jgi:acyl-CoA synthetase (AMP-forming)/AMP-acid ligase II
VRWILVQRGAGAALFGAAKAGLYPVPVNTRYKSLALADLARHSRMRVLITTTPEPGATGAPDFPAMLTEAFPGLDEQDGTHPAISIVQVVSAPDDYYVEVPAAFIQLKPGATATEEEIVAFCAGKIATFRVPRYVRFVTEWPMSGTKIKKAILRQMIVAYLKEKGITQTPRIETVPAG